MKSKNIKNFSVRPEPVEGFLRTNKLLLVLLLATAPVFSCFAMDGAESQPAPTKLPDDYVPTKTKFEKYGRLGFYGGGFAITGTLGVLSHKELKDKNAKFKDVCKDFFTPKKFKQTVKEYPKTSAAIIASMTLVGGIGADQLHMHVLSNKARVKHHKNGMDSTVKKLREDQKALADKKMSPEKRKALEDKAVKKREQHDQYALKVAESELVLAQKKYDSVEDGSIEEAYWRKQLEVCNLKRLRAREDAKIYEHCFRAGGVCRCRSGLKSGVTVDDIQALKEKYKKVGALNTTYQSLLESAVSQEAKDRLFIVNKVGNVIGVKEGVTEQMALDLQEELNVKLQDELDFTLPRNRNSAVILQFIRAKRCDLFKTDAFEFRPEVTAEDIRDFRTQFTELDQGIVTRGLEGLPEEFVRLKAGEELFNADRFNRFAEDGGASIREGVTQETFDAFRGRMVEVLGEDSVLGIDGAWRNFQQSSQQ
jgi:hypothetical protein